MSLVNLRIRIQGEPDLCLSIQLDFSSSISSKSLYNDLLDKIQCNVKNLSISEYDVFLDIEDHPVPLHDGRSLRKLLDDESRPLQLLLKRKAHISDRSTSVVFQWKPSSSSSTDACNRPSTAGRKRTRRSNEEEGEKDDDDNDNDNDEHARNVRKDSGISLEDEKQEKNKQQEQQEQLQQQQQLLLQPIRKKQRVMSAEESMLSRTLPAPTLFADHLPRNMIHPLDRHLPPPRLAFTPPARHSVTLPAISSITSTVLLQPPPPPTSTTTTDTRRSNSSPTVIRPSPPRPMRASPQFVCDKVTDQGNVCGQTFRRSYDLSRHQTIHLKNRPYCHCQQCGKKFTRMDALRRHERVQGHGNANKRESDSRDRK